MEKKTISFLICSLLLVLVFFGCTTNNNAQTTQPTNTHHTTTTPKQQKANKQQNTTKANPIHTSPQPVVKQNKSKQRKQPTPNNNQNTENVTIATLLSKSTAMECVIHESIGGNETMYMDITTIPSKYVIIKTYVTDKQGKPIPSLVNSTGVIDIQNREEYLQLPKTKNSSLNCDGAPHVCYWIRKNLTAQQLSDLELKPVGAGKNVHCQVLNNPPKPPINPQEACTSDQLKQNIGYCLCAPLKDINQTAYEKCMNFNKTKEVASEPISNSTFTNQTTIMQMKPTYNQSAFINNTKVVVLNITNTTEMNETNSNSTT